MLGCLGMSIQFWLDRLDELLGLQISAVSRKDEEVLAFPNSAKDFF